MPSDVYHQLSRLYSLRHPQRPSTDCLGSLTSRPLSTSVAVTMFLHCATGRGGADAKKAAAAAAIAAAATAKTPSDWLRVSAIFFLGKGGGGERDSLEGLAMTGPVFVTVLAMSALRPDVRVSRRPPRILCAATLPRVSPAALAVSSGAMVELTVSVALGYLTVATGLLSPVAVNQLAKVVYNFLLPAFLFSSVVRTVTSYGLSRGMLAIPLLASLQICAGLLMSRVVLKALRKRWTTGSGRRFVTCATFGNSGVLPLLLTDAIFRHGDAAVLARSSSYVSFFLLGWSPIFWSLGSAVLCGGESGREGPRVEPGMLRKVLSPPIVAALSGLAIAIAAPERAISAAASPIRMMLTVLTNFGRAYPPSALLVLAGSLASTAQRGAQRETDPDLSIRGSTEEDHGDGVGFGQCVAGVMACRYVLNPTVAVCVLSLLRRLGIVPSMAQDPLLAFVVLLQSAMPPAQNSVIMLQKEDRLEGAQEMSRLLFVTYLLAALPISLLVSLFLDYTGL